MPKDRDIELDPRFFVPPSVIDVRQENKETYDFLYTSPGDIADSGPVLEFPEAVIPNAPSSYRIVKQTLRTTPDGRVLVDVELEFPDLGNGVNDIDVRTTPA